MSRAFVIALLGAESTGKTTLAAALCAALARPERRVALVSEYLREFCDATCRTPRQDEQAGIAAEQSRRIAIAAADHDIVVADTTALMIGVYSDHVFGDKALYAAAQRDHAAACNITLLTALDLPWQADGLQRDGPHVREPVDTLVRAALQRAGCSYAVVSGSGQARLQTALASVERALSPPAESDASPRWQWHCDRCGDAGCEAHERRRVLPRDLS